MTVRRENLSRVIAIAAVIALPLISSGCTTRPDTDLDWDSPTISHKQAQAAPKPKPRPVQRSYAAAPRPRCNCDDAQYAQDNKYWYTPTPRPRDHDDYADSGKANFGWPVKGGRVIEEFGSTRMGERNDGINIAVSEGTPIYAAGDGTVSYSGNELKSYGNLVLVRHDNGFVSAYAHADHFVVYKGDRVVRGQLIGYVGETGDVNRPQLHFELRRGQRGETPVNPRRFLGEQQIAYRD
jgi:Membrane proteins related to metalloendopeptidases